ncbi:hypothetical protein WA76_06990 [Streptococcus agalactiae]|nr:hypothetical protein WA76_06990 [Streptococcus agalactiae]
MQVLCGHPLPVNPIATPKLDYREVAGRGRDSEIMALEQKRDMKAYIADEGAINSKVQIGSRNLYT